MCSIEIKKAKEEELLFVKKMQDKYNRKNLDAATRRRDGFLSLVTNFLSLKDLHDDLGVVVATDNSKLVGFEIPVRLELCDEIPLFIPLKERLLRTTFNGIKLDTSNTVVAGQICVDKHYHSQGIGEAMHSFLCNKLQQEYQFLAVEIDHSNGRSLHFSQKKLGLEKVSTYNAYGTTWHILAQDIRDIQITSHLSPAYKESQ